MISTGFSNLDAVLDGGFDDPCNVIVAGGAGVGKTQLLVMLATEVARGRRTLYASAGDSLYGVARVFDLMGQRADFMRILCGERNVDSAMSSAGTTGAVFLDDVNRMTWDGAGRIITGRDIVDRCVAIRGENSALSMFFGLHVNKGDDTIEARQAYMHDRVDTVIRLKRDGDDARIVHAHVVKHRSGSMGVATFRMGDGRWEEIA